ncbi:uncharacterized protein [Venturia canescens]|uniref:uncharacterized protein isoform X2 n=1 Tax=Venturia canescens TaxID=32260 RepID=UPI001C9CEF8A|nr:uncharacterized protein LOC122406984 isoform X2 [Venturia canescens]
MSEITEILLTKYYGFGADPNNKNYLSSHEAIYDPKKFDKKTESTESAEKEAIEEATSQRTSVEGKKDDEEDGTRSIRIEAVRSSRAILDVDSFEEGATEIYEYESLLESTLPQENDVQEGHRIIQDFKEPLTPEKEKKADEATEILNQNGSKWTTHFDEASEHASDISSVRTTKKTRNKSALTTSGSTLSSQTLQPPKKLPSCNGIFLDMTNLSLLEFPLDIIANLPNLRMLYLENNSLTNLPDELFSGLRVLQWLDLRNNQLKSLPATVKHHQCLETILLDGNLFEELPLELCLLPNLKELQASRNPLFLPPPDILGLGFAATINFLRNEWNKLHPDEAVSLPEREKKAKLPTILCSDPPVVKTTSKTSRIFGSASTGHIGGETKKTSVRERGWNYKPSNRCKNRGSDEALEMRLLWIAKVKEMLTKQTLALQKIKDQDALKNWRRDRRSYKRSMSRAASRTEEDTPFGIDIHSDGSSLKSQSKMPLQSVKTRKRHLDWATNIDHKMKDLYESLNQLEKSRESKTMTPRSEQKLLENEIKKVQIITVPRRLVSSSIHYFFLFSSFLMYKTKSRVFVDATTQRWDSAQALIFHLKLSHTSLRRPSLYKILKTTNKFKSSGRKFKDDSEMTGLINAMMWIFLILFVKNLTKCSTRAEKR